MSRPVIRVHNLETNEIIDREMNDDEYAQHLKTIEIYQEESTKAQAAAKTKADLLHKLGITEEEAKLLLS